MLCEQRGKICQWLLLLPADRRTLAMHEYECLFDAPEPSRAAHVCNNDPAEHESQKQPGWMPIKFPVSRRHWCSLLLS
jgi:hypothetical protein